MLTYPDRQRFEQIRAQWETAQPSDEGQADMAGWRDKPTPRPPACVDSHENGGSKFRRKLSNGFSRITNPLSQRKVTPDRSQLEAPPLATTESLTTATSVYDDPVLPARKSTSLVDLARKSKDKAGYSDTNGPSKNANVHTTTRPQPRSRTLSFIPLPVKNQSDISTVDIDGVIKANPLATMSQPESESFHSKIPSPSPEVYEHRCYSPRRYLHHHASYNASPQSGHATASNSFARVNEVVPANSSQLLEPCTTQNVAKGPNKLQAAGFMAPRKPGPRRSVASSRFEKPVLQENIPNDKRIANMRPQIQERPLKRESLAVAGTLHDRRSFGTRNLFMQGRGTGFATPQNASQRIISQTSQNTPVTVKRVQRDDRFFSQTSNRSTMKPGPVSKNSLLSTSRASILHEVEPSKQFVLRSFTQADFSWETPGTPQGLGGISRLTRGIEAVNHEVSKLPRSQTFHSFGAQPEDAPPVPPLPVKYRKSSLSDMTRQYRMMHDTPIKSFHGRVISDASLCIVEEISEEMVDHDSTTGPIEAGSAPSRPETPTSSTASSIAFPLTSNTPHNSKLEIVSTPYETIRSSQETSGENWGVREQAMLDVANIAVLQVEDYMPPQYWAGRFQSRYDQWRTDAMNAELGFHSEHQMSSPLSEFKLDQENPAACYIFAQLSDLCGSDRAADSLWEFEYKYRKDNKLLSNPANLLKRPIVSKRDNRTAQGEAETGAFGRAIKKLTPRKSSLANLMKGKGWSKADEWKQHNRLEENQEPSSGDP